MGKFLSITAVCVIIATTGRAGDDMTASPTVYENDSHGAARALAERNLYRFELAARKRFEQKDAPDEIVVLASSSPIDFHIDLNRMPDSIENVLNISISRDRGKLERITDYGNKREEHELSKDQVEAIRKFIADNEVDKMPPLEALRTVRGKQRAVLDGTNYVYLHLNARSGTRVNINNPPTKGFSDYPPDDPSWKHREVVDFFKGLKPAEPSAGK
jgi:hypothetical protein